MSVCCRPDCDATARHFDRTVAGADLERYHVLGLTYPWNRPDILAHRRVFEGGRVSIHGEGK